MLQKHPNANAVTQFNFANLVGALKVWGDYGYGFFAGFQAEEEVKLIQRHIDVITDFVACFKSYTSASYVEKEVNVTHFVWKFEDVK